MSTQAQIQINGIVKNNVTKKPLPFATLKFEDNTEAFSDVNGKFSVTCASTNTFFSIHFLGFETQKKDISGQPFFTIFLNPKTENLKDVEIENNDKANLIIKKAFENRKKNNPFEKLNSFQFDSYNKLIVTANPDSIAGKIDSIFNKTDKGIVFSKIDSSEYKFKKIIDKQHLFLAEKISQFLYLKPTFKEVITGAKMAGFKEPFYEYYGFNLQSFSIYDDKYELFETKYISPIGNRYKNEYQYKIIDTVQIQNRKTFVIYFKNKKILKGLEGLLYIDAENYAIAKTTLRARSVLDITSEHFYTYFPEENIWFPVKKTLKIVKGKSKQETKILGGRITFEAENNDASDKKNKSSDYVYLHSETDINNITFNDLSKIRKSYISVDVKDQATTRDEDFWKSKRSEEIDERSLATYRVLDSIGNKRKIDKKIFIGRKIINGFLPVSFFDFDLRHLLSYNNYEGFRFGIGGNTNEFFSKIFKIEGYTAFGLKDETIKYNLGTSTRIGKFSNTWIGGSYTDDIREIASTNFAIDKRVFKLYDPRPINLSTFYNHKTWRAYIETKIIPKTESIWQITHSEISPLFEYTFQKDGTLYRNFSATTAMVSLQWNPFSSFMQTPNGKQEIEKRFPKFTFQFTKTIPNFIDNYFDFGKIDFRIDFEKKYLNGQKSTILAQAGYAFGDIPLTHLYNTSPNNLTKDNILQRITIAGKNSFETMFFNEFFSSQYAMLQLKHGFKRVQIAKKIRPTMVLVTRMAWGNMQNPEQHHGIEYKTLDKGFFESGIELNQIYKGFGLTGFYRYGANQLSRFEDNLAIKLSFILDLGLD
ncbi:hypothetical protein GCM10011508_08520 [Flavobacterium lutivivi]|nr:hypothetical protein GCM10011508_08520 [Flavobacterium lutivivi]